MDPEFITHHRNSQGIVGFDLVLVVTSSSLLAARGLLDMAYAYWADETYPERYDDVKLGMQMLKDAGFSKVKLWHEYGIFAMTAKEYAETKRIAAGKLLAVFPPEVQQKICKEIEEEVQKRFVDGNELITIDFIMLLCTK